MIALVDCNNFYASCETIFRPELKEKPIIVLSNQDGAVISRSNASKVLGVKMGVPYYQIKEICDKYGVQIFSSNYALYNSMSKRVMSILGNFAVSQEIYSIDESFLDLNGIDNLTAYSEKMRTTVMQWTSIPISVGLGSTKVLAKFANYLAKKHKFLDNVCNLEELGETRVNKAMQITDVAEVWGVGWRVSRKLKQMNINTVYDLKIANPSHIRKIFNINMERVVQELNGIKCIDLEELKKANRHIISSRNFDHEVTSRDDLKSAFIYHIENVCGKMRKQNLFARQIIFCARTNRFKDNYFSTSIEIAIPSALDSFRYISSYIDRALDAIYKPDIKYKKCGVIVNGLITGEYVTKDLFDNTNIKHDKVLPAVEKVRMRFGKSAIKLASANLSDAWKMEQRFLSKRYTTDLNELLEVV
ncbi:MAG: domain protein DNA-repair protein [Burkholderiales bacterium]|nr:domain protein DNA-repair protein [Burkholderiales bacterium]